MIEDVKDYLPIGSIVLLKSGKKRLMVFGIIQADQEKPELEYDYIGVPYPEGNMGENYQYLFYHKDIVEVFFRGFEDVERQNFMSNLVDFYKDKQEKK